MGCMTRHVVEHKIEFSNLSIIETILTYISDQPVTI